MEIGDGWYQKVRRFSSNGFWKNIGCLISAPTFDLGVSRLWKKESEIKIIVKKRKRHSIPINVDLYEVYIYFIFYFLLFYFMTILTAFFVRFLVYLSLGGINSDSIGQNYLGLKSKR